MHALGLVPAWLGEPALVPKLLVLVLTAVPVVLLMWIPSSRLRHPASGGVLFVTTLVLGLWLLIWALATQYDGLWGFSMLFVPWLVGPWVILLLALFLLRLLNVVQETRDGP